MKVVIAIDSFKGSLGSLEAGAAAARGVRAACPEAACVVRPLADGGEGTTAALVGGLGGELREVTVSGPLGEPTRATYGLLPCGRAVLEMAEAAGITRIPACARDPRRTTTFGVGEMIREAHAAGARAFVIGIGGSATNDGGAGMLQALGWRLEDAHGRELPRGGAALAHLSRIRPPAPEWARELSDCSFRIACDVTNPLCGPLGASAVFGPQKGADAATVRELDSALAHFADVAEAATGRTERTTPGAGAAGGLGFAFRAFLRAELTPGVDLVLDETELARELADADFVLTGEGRLDGQTAMGKAPIGVARLARRHGSRTIAICGCVGEGVEAVHAAGIDAYFPILREVTTLEKALDKSVASRNLTETVEQVFRALKAAVRPE